MKRGKRGVMKTFLCVCSVVFVISTWASAQVQDARWNAYAFLAPGTSTIGGVKGRATFHIGGGAEGFIYRGLSLGAEIGPFIPFSPPGRGISLNVNDWVHGLGSSNIAYHFLSNTADRKLDPFVTGGYSLFFANLDVPGVGFTKTQSGYNAGGGANFWLLRRAAMRLEFRHQSSVWYKTMEVRVGMTFR
jgi:opacity protein-like surface antigen